MSFVPSASHTSRTAMSRSSPPPPYRVTPLSAEEALNDRSSTNNTTLNNHSSSSTSQLASITTALSSAGEAGPSRSRRRRLSSSSSMSDNSQSGFYPTPDHSTAPTSPQQSVAGGGERIWRRTANVPHNFRRNRRNSQPHEDEHNRWLSEDEGLGSAGSSVRPRRSLRRTANRSTDRDDRGNGGGGGGDAGPTTRSTRANPRDKVLTHDDAIAGIAEAKMPSHSPTGRPHPVRTRSYEPTPSSSRSNLPVVPVDVTQQTLGTYPPDIAQLVPPPRSATETYVGLGIRTTGAGPIHPIASGNPVTDEAAAPPAFGSIPDFARGRGGDGIGGFDMPMAGGSEDVNEAMTRSEGQRALVEKLRRILACALCPPTDGVTPALHHPVTLPCGHTISSSHISIPAPPPLQFTHEAPHEIYAAQQRQHQQRLNLWAAVMCPIPTCKRYSPSVGSSAVLSDIADLSAEGGFISSGAQRGEMLASGVTYYPPPPQPPAYSSDPPPTDGGSPLLDISVEKVLRLVQREMMRVDESDQDIGRGGNESDATEESDEEEEVRPSGSQGDLARDFSHLASPSVRTSRLNAELGDSAMIRTSSKRRRHDHRSAQRMRPTMNQVEDWPFEKELGGMLECDVCALLLYEPVTTPCQHSFCSKCLSRSLDHSSRCPVCRQDLPSFAFFQDHAVNKVLVTILKTAFPAEYAERQAAIERDERDARLDTPIFVCTLAFPGMPTILHVFEPRYRLMIRRCIESTNPRFGMVLPARGTGAPTLQGVMEYGTMLEIQSVQMLPDGRSMVETVGIHRFKLLEKGNLDGYTVGRIERIDDVSPEEEIVMEREAVSARAVALAALAAAASTSTTTTTSPTPPAAANTASGASLVPSIPPNVPGAVNPLAFGGSNGITSGPVDFATLASQAMSTASSGTSIDDTPETTEELMTICRAFIDQLRSGSAPWLLQRLNNTYGVMPEDPSEFSYWMALVMPIDEYEKARLLPIRSPRLRLKLIVHWVESLRSSWW
ncbi:hypothetical protein CI109_102002 [Kwoniella shandongensis]|uniref:RING-type domain-containing protein n=1 Tax=Kwoniella shandongensis TaxID=1734106 RepID=A0AAJ8MWE1_9TREE